MTTLIAKFDENTATATAAAWSQMREIMARADRPKPTDHVRLAEAMAALGITRDKLPDLLAITKEFAGLVNVDEQLAQALVSAENAKAELAKAEADGEVKVKAFVEWRDQFQIHLFRVRAFVEAADKGTTAAQQRRDRRVELIQKHADLLGASDEARAIELAAFEAGAALAAAELAESLQGGIDELLRGRLTDILPLPAEMEERVIDELARKGTVSSTTIDPAQEPREIEPQIGNGERWQRIISLRESLAARLGRGAITRAEAGRAVVELAVRRGLIPAKGSDATAVASREPARITGGWK